MPETISFEAAIAFTENLFTQNPPDLELNQEPDQALEQALTELVRSDNGARGFFVFYLTNQIADNPTEPIISALRSVPEPSAELLVKNLAMSVAMKITHRRNGNEAMALSSEKVSVRTANLIKLLNLAEVKIIADLMRTSALSGGGKYEDFLKKWGYDFEQRAAIAAATAL